MLWLSWGEVARCSSNSEAFCLAAGSSQAWENRASVGVRWPAGKHPAQQRGNRPPPPPLPADEVVVLFHEGWHLGLSEADTGSLETSRRSVAEKRWTCGQRLQCGALTPLLSRHVGSSCERPAAGLWSPPSCGGADLR